MRMQNRFKTDFNLSYSHYKLTNFEPVLCLYLVNTMETFGVFSVVFRWYGKELLAWNTLYYHKRHYFDKYEHFCGSLHTLNKSFLNACQDEFRIMNLVHTHKIFRKTNNCFPLIRTCVYVCISGGKNVGFSENFAYVLNRWFLLAP